MSNIKLLGSLVEGIKDGITPIIQAVRLNEFLELQFPSRVNILDPWLPEAGLALIYAYRGIGKTYFCLEVGIAVAFGAEFMGFKAPRRAKVLFIDGEMPAHVLQERLKQIIKRYQGSGNDYIEPTIITPDIQNGCMPDLSTASGREALRPYTDEADLIIVDNISTLSGYLEEDSGDSWVPIQQWALRQRTLGKTVLFVHHAGKKGAQRGTSRREDILDTVIALRRSKNYRASMGAQFELHFEKARRITGDSVNPILCHLTEEGWNYESINEDNFQRVIELANQELRQVDIVQQLNLSKSQVSKLYNKAKEQGLIEFPVSTI
jgi:putative DNA primase/helicase